MKAPIRLISICLLLPGLACADTTLTYSEPGEKEAGMRILISGNKVTLKTAGQGSFAIFDAKNKALTVVMTETRKYMLMDNAALDRASAAMTMAKARMEKQMENMPPAQQEQMRKMLARMGDGANPMADKNKSAHTMPEYEATGEERTIDGRNCQVMQIDIGGNKRNLVCLAEIEDLGMAKADHEVLLAMHQYMQEMTSRFEHMSGSPASMDQFVAGKIPLEITQQDDQGNSTIRRLKSISSEAIDPKLLAVPEDYTPMRMPSMGSPR